MMSSGVLSQEEIDALLRGGDDPSPEPAAAAASPADSIVEPQADFSEMEKDVIGEIANISMGTSATTLSTLLGKKVDITTPTVGLITKNQLKEFYPSPFVMVNVQYTEGLRGSNVLIIHERDAAVICDLMMGGDGTAPPGELSELHISAVSEAMNQMMGSSSTSLSTMLKQKIDISPPRLDIINLAEEGLREPSDEVLVKISFKMVIHDLIDSEIMQLYPVPFAKDMVKFLMGGTGDSVSGASAEPAPVPNQPAAAAPPSQPMAQPIAPAPQPMPSPMAAAPMDYQQQPMAQQPPMYPQQQPMYQQPMYQQPMYQQPMYQQPPMAPAIPVQPVQFAPLQTNSPVKDVANLNLIMDVPLQITVELGKAKKSIREVLELGPGSVIELDKLAGEPVDLLVNGKLLAKGEVVVIDENFGVRITDIVNPIERLTNLQ